MTGLSHFQRINPSAEMVMIDRMFNQEERASLSRDKRLALVDPGKERRSKGWGELLPWFRGREPLGRYLNHVWVQTLKVHHEFRGEKNQDRAVYE